MTKTILLVKVELKKGTKKSKTPVLDNFGRDLTAMAEEGKLDPVVGREKEIQRVSQILSRRKEKQSFTHWRTWSRQISHRRRFSHSNHQTKGLTNLI